MNISLAYLFFSSILLFSFTANNLDLRKIKTPMSVSLYFNSPAYAALVDSESLLVKESLIEYKLSKKKIFPKNSKQEKMPYEIKNSFEEGIFQRHREKNLEIVKKQGGVEKNLGKQVRFGEDRGVQKQIGTEKKVALNYLEDSLKIKNTKVKPKSLNRKNQKKEEHQRVVSEGIRVFSDIAKKLMYEERARQELEYKELFESQPMAFKNRYERGFKKAQKTKAIKIKAVRTRENFKQQIKKENFILTKNKQMWFKKQTTKPENKISYNRKIKKPSSSVKKVSSLNLNSMGYKQMFQSQPFQSQAFQTQIPPAEKVKVLPKIFTASGRIELSEGLGVLGDEVFVVKRIFQGIVKEKTQSVSLTHPTYVLSMKEPLGKIRAELLAPNGVVLGWHEKTLKTELEDQVQNFSLKPPRHGLKIKVVSSYSYGGQEIPVRNSKVFLGPSLEPLKSNENATFKAPLMLGSSEILKAQADGFWPTLKNIYNNGDVYIKLFPNEFIASFLAEAFNENLPEPENISLIWGRVVQNGKPKRGIEIQVSGKAGEVFYFNGFLPDNKLKKTSSNGVFVVVLKTNGVQTLRAIEDEKVLWSQIIPLEFHHISPVEIYLGREKEIPLYTVNPFSGDLEEAPLHLVGFEEEFFVKQGEGRLVFSETQGPVIFEMDSYLNYENTRYFLDSQSGFFEIPLIQKSWLATLLSQHEKGMMTGNQGVVIGFIEQKIKNIYLNSIKLKPSDVLFFDKSGKPTKKEKAFGFVVLGLKGVLQNISVELQMEKPGGFKNKTSNASDQKEENFVLSRFFVSDGHLTTVLVFPNQ